MAPVESHTGNTVKADDSEADLNVDVINAGHAPLKQGGGGTLSRVPSPSGSSSTIVSVARSAAS